MVSHRNIYHFSLHLAYLRPPASSPGGSKRASFLKDLTRSRRIFVRVMEAIMAGVFFHTNFVKEKKTQTSETSKIRGCFFVLTKKYLMFFSMSSKYISFRLIITTCMIWISESTKHDNSKNMCLLDFCCCSLETNLAISAGKRPTTCEFENQLVKVFN